MKGAGTAAESQGPIISAYTKLPSVKKKRMITGSSYILVKAASLRFAMTRSIFTEYLICQVPGQIFEIHVSQDR